MHSFPKIIIKLYSTTNISVRIAKYDKNDAYHSHLSQFKYHFPQSVLGRHCTGLLAIHRRCSNSSSHNSCDNLVKLILRTHHRHCGIRHLLASKRACNAYISKNVSKTGITSSYQFSCKI